MNVDVLIRQLPPYEGTERLVKRRQDTFDIMREMMKKHKAMASHYDRIDPNEVWKGDAMSTARALFDLCKANIGYVVEPTLTQTVKSPAAILHDREGDCKHYASMIVGICCMLQRRGYPIMAKYRFASYDRDTTHPGHVFAVVQGPDHREMWVDPVLDTFNQRTPVYFSKIDKVPPIQHSAVSGIGKLYDINGINAIGVPTDQVVSLGNIFETKEYTRAIRPLHWLDNWGGHMDPQVTDRMQGLPYYQVTDIGKAKKKHRGLKLHIKIKPGNLLKKVGLAPSRNAYLLLLKLNVFDMAVKLHKAGAGALAKLHAWWKKEGGNGNKLNTAINQGVKLHNKLHKNSKVNGLSEQYLSPFNQPDINPGRIGFAFVAIPAALAAAAPLIAKIKGLLKSVGVDTDHLDAQTAAADSQVADAHNAATDTPGDGNADVNPDGSVDHGNGVTTKVTTDPTTGKQTMTTDVKDPTTGGDDDSGAAPAAATTTPATTAADVDANPNTPAATPGGGGSFIDTAKDWLGSHKVQIAQYGGGIAAGILLAKSFAAKPKDKTKYFIGAAVLGIGGVAAGYIMKQVDKKTN